MSLLSQGSRIPSRRVRLCHARDSGPTQLNPLRVILIVGLLTAQPCLASTPTPPWLEPFDASQIQPPMSPRLEDLSPAPEALPRDLDARPADRRLFLKGRLALQLGFPRGASESFLALDASRRSALPTRVPGKEDPVQRVSSLGYIQAEAQRVLAEGAQLDTSLRALERAALLLPDAEPDALGRWMAEAIEIHDPDLASALFRRLAARSEGDVRSLELLADALRAMLIADSIHRYRPSAVARHVERAVDERWSGVHGPRGALAVGRLARFIRIYAERRRDTRGERFTDTPLPAAVLDTRSPLGVLLAPYEGHLYLMRAHAMMAEGDWAQAAITFRVVRDVYDIEEAGYGLARARWHEALECGPRERAFCFVQFEIHARRFTHASPLHAKAPEILLLRAWSFEHIGEPAPAREALERFATRYADHPLAPHADAMRRRLPGATP